MPAAKKKATKSKANGRGWDRRVRLSLALIAAIASCGPVPAFADGASQKLWPGELSIDVKPPGARCAGPFQPNPPPGVYRACPPHGTPYSVNIVSHSDLTKSWTASVAIVPPTPGISVELGCDQSALIDDWCHKLGSGEALLTLAPGERRPRYPLTVKVADSGAPYGREVLIHFCLTRDGLSPLCVDRTFTTSGGKRRPR